jgi:hypothetical protein
MKKMERKRLWKRKKKRTGKEKRRQTILEGEKRKYKKKEAQKQGWKGLVTIIRKMEYSIDINGKEESTCTIQ